MGNHYIILNTKCPLYKGVVETTNHQLLAIRCEDLSKNLGFDVEMLIRLKNRNDLKDYTELLCKGLYTSCPYYKAYLRERDL